MSVRSLERTSLGSTLEADSRPQSATERKTEGEAVLLSRSTTKKRRQERQSLASARRAEMTRNDPLSKNHLDRILVICSSGELKITLKERT